MEKKTGYVALLFPVFVSPGTAPTSTFRSVFAPNGGWPMSLDVNVFFAAGALKADLCRLTIGFGLAWIVSVTGTPTSWQQPEFSTVTANARSVEARIVVGSDGERRMCCGSA